MKQRILSVCACVFVGLCVSALSASDKFYTRYVHACYPELRLSLSLCLPVPPADCNRHAKVVSRKQQVF